MERTRSISKSMISYLRRAREHKEFLLKETKEFERGKRHLANMMGLQAQEMTQSDIDDAIKYLFPSGLFDKRARPIMKHPELLFKSQKDAQFDIEGRPYHYLFYTTKPNYYESLSTISAHLRELNKFEDEQFAEGILDAPDIRAFMASRDWMSLDEMKNKFLENLSEIDYEYIIKCLSNLAKHPYSSRVRPFLEEFSKELPERSLDVELPEIKRDEKTGLVYTEMVEKHREHVFRVKTVLNGTGIVDILGQDILCLPHPYLRLAVLHPLRLANMQDKVDIYVTVVTRPLVFGWSSLVTCVKLAVSRSIAAYAGPELRERMRLAGLLTRDMRRKERKKFGQEGARRKYTWKKR